VCTDDRECLPIAECFPYAEEEDHSVERTCRQPKLEDFPQCN
jgi:hypothetical protein